MLTLILISIVETVESCQILALSTDENENLLKLKMV